MRIIIAIILAFVLFSCAHSKSKLSILFDRVDNLEMDSPVKVKGITVGEVSRIKLFRDSVLVEVQFSNPINIPVGSKFFIYAPMVGPAYISIDLSGEKTLLTGKDTVAGSYIQKGILENMVADSTRRKEVQKSLDKIADGINELIKASRDSSTKK